MSGAVTELYVYYKVRRADADALHAALRGFVAAMRLLRRADESGELQTWMEIHTNETTEAAAAAAVAHLVVGSRHIERFTAP